MQDLCIYPKCYLVELLFLFLLMLLLVALIFRAVSFEFRSKVESRIWRRTWDFAFGFGSLISAFLLGVAFGNILIGVPIDANGNFIGTFLDLLNPYSICIGSLNILLFTMHGAVYLAGKSEGELQNRCQKLAQNTWIYFTALHVVITIWTWFAAPFLFEKSPGNPFFYIFLIVLISTVVILPVLFKDGKFNRAFLASSIMIAMMLGQASLSLYPRFVPSSVDLKYSLTIYNASSSDLTLQTMLVIALIGMPIVITYSFFIHRIFRGKVDITEESY